MIIIPKKPSCVEPNRTILNTNVGLNNNASKASAESTSRSATDSCNRKTKYPKPSPNGLPPIISASDFLGQDDDIPPVLIEGLLHQGSTMLVSGGSKTNKTFSLLDMALCVASGTPWWGMDTTKGKVLYIDFELDARFLRKRLRSICIKKGFAVESLRNVDIWALRGHVADFDVLARQIIERIETDDYVLIIIDPIYKAMGNRDENKAGDINSLLNGIQKLATETDASVVYAHHFSKGNQAGKESIDRMSGSGVFARAPDSIVSVTRHASSDDTYTVEATLRNFKHLEPFCVEWEYPLMTRNDVLDPANLKKPKTKVEQFTTKQLLVALDGDSLSTSEWRDRSMKQTGMSERTFMAKKAQLTTGPNSVVVLRGDKWVLASLADIPKQNSNNEVQQGAK